jgi:Flp pilus assembly pilin Flp
MQRLRQMWNEEDGVLSFEWTLLLTLLTLGIVGGLAAARDAVIDEMGDVAEAAQGIDQSYSLAPISFTFGAPGDPFFFEFTSSGSSFEEVAADAVFTDCARSTFVGGQATISDTDS